MLKLKLRKPENLTDKQRRKIVSRMCSGKSHYVAQRKWDGIRLIGGRIDGKIKLLGEDATDYTDKLPHLVKELEGIIEGNGDTVLDGELIWRAHEDAREDPERLHQALEVGGDGCEWIVFDLIKQLGHDQSKKRYHTRLHDAWALVLPDQYHGPVKTSISCVKNHYLSPVSRGVAESIELVEQKARDGDWDGIVVRESAGDGFWQLHRAPGSSLLRKAITAGLRAIDSKQTTFDFLKHVPKPRRPRGNARTRARRARAGREGATR